MIWECYLAFSFLCVLYCVYDLQTRTLLTNASIVILAEIAILVVNPTPSPTPERLYDFHFFSGCQMFFIISGLMACLFLKFDKNYQTFTSKGVF
jgi:hypothetical protein